MARTHYVLSIGDLVGKSLSIYFRNILPFTLIAAAVLSPWIAFEFWFDAYADGLSVENEDAALIIALGGLGSLIFQTALAFMMTGALTYGVVQQLRGEPASVAEALNQGVASFFRVLGTSLLVGLRVVLWSLLLYVPGIIEQVRLYVAIPAAVMEGKSAGEAVERSVRLTDGSRWQIFGSWMLIGVLGAVIGGILGASLFMLNDGFDPDSPWVGVIAQLLLTPFGATMGATAYFLLRMGKENVDAKQIAAVFD
jgi:hypothetical protein